jgi:hypothetical protein
MATAARSQHPTAQTGLRREEAVAPSTTHVVRFLDGGELRYACDHLGQLTELASLGLRSTVTDDCTVVFNPLPPADLEG